MFSFYVNYKIKREVRNLCSKRASELQGFDKKAFFRKSYFSDTSFGAEFFLQDIIKFDKQMMR